MTWIKVIDVPDAENALREAYDEVASARGEVGNILKAHSLRPKVLTTHLRLYRELMFGRSELSRAERETIAVAVSVVNECHY
jgi:alkylhydroperoxidase family enzyme